jgi:ribosomal protein S18 acetylase RimI-like enzyme
MVLGINTRGFISMRCGSHQLNIRSFHLKDEAEVIRLWENCELVVPQNHPGDDIACKLKVQPELFLVGVMQERIISTIMAGYEGHRGWINYLAVAPEHRRKGIGRRMMVAVEEKLRRMGCPKINLQVRETNSAVIEFYKRLGYLNDHVIGLGKRLN